MPCAVATVSGYRANNLAPENEVTVIGDVTAYRAKGLNPALEVKTLSVISAYPANDLLAENEVAINSETLFYKSNSLLPEQESVTATYGYVYCALGLDSGLDKPSPVGSADAYRALGLDPVLEAKTDYSIEFYCSKGVGIDYVRMSAIGDHRITTADVFRKYK